ncbi:TOTE conflict system archaeo-eukaryotic primase domain-containing protein [Lactiplantibacillus pentosus]
MGKQFTFKTIAIDRKTGNKCAVYIDQQSHEMMVTPLADFQSLLSAPASSGGASGHWSEEEKLSIFRSLFKGRDDVYAKRYFNKRAGRYVYSPATRFKDGRPMRDKTLPLTDNVIKDHLNGKQFIGVYPLLKDDTTNFLVIDIDKSNWQMIIKSLKKVASQQGVPVFIECSQSGNGGHLWVFFEHTLTAKLARQLGQQLLERAMAINPEISFAAFDRLFPNQDTMPSGGYGNLIAAPLQLERLRQGRSAFIDENFKPYRDQ